MHCPRCTSAMQHDARNVTQTYKEESITIEQVHGHFCLQCGLMVPDEGEAGRMADIMLAFQKRVNGQRFNGAFIERIRLKLHLTQKEAASIFGGGVNAFSRYETGRTTPPPPLVLLFKLLDAHPRLLLTELSDYIPPDLHHKLLEIALQEEENTPTSRR